jgi:hypothetical protein
MSVLRNFPPDEDDLRARAVDAFGEDAVERSMTGRKSKVSAKTRR